MDGHGRSDSESEGFWNNNAASMAQSELDFMGTNNAPFFSATGFSDANIPLYEVWFKCLPVYPKNHTGSRISRKSATQIVQLFRQKYRLSDAALDDLLHTLGSVFLPGEHTFPMTMWSFREVVEKNSCLDVVFTSPDNKFVIYDARKQLETIVAGIIS